MQILESLNSRELAIIIVIALAIPFGFRHKSVRRSFNSVIKAAFVKQLIVIYTLAIFYVIIGVYILFLLGFWSEDNIKDTAFWILFSAFVTIFRIRDTENNNYFIDAIKDNFKFTLIVEFVFGLYTFNIIIEINFNYLYFFHCRNNSFFK